VAVEDGTGGTRPPARAITVRDLLLHVSGLNHRTSREYQTARVRARDIALPQFVTNIVRVPLKEDPGTRFRYSESTTVVGRLIEVVSGERFDQFLSRHVLQPLGMRDTLFAVPPEARPRLTTVYKPVDGGRLEEVELEVVPFTQTPALFEGAVGLVSTVPDYLRFAQMLLNGGSLDGARLLRTETVAQMVTNGLTPEVLATRRNGTGWGLGNVEITLKPGAPDYPLSVGEYGWNGTSGPIFWVNPSKKMVTVLMLQSADPSNPARIWQRFRSAVEQAVITP
jgi:CubicO group peptidase (beta-lactamase class C family)